MGREIYTSRGFFLEIFLARAWGDFRGSRVLKACRADDNQEQRPA
jgi:hypothetical protein